MHHSKRACPKAGRAARAVALHAALPTTLLLAAIAAAQAAGPPAIYIIDSTQSLASFDMMGNRVATTALPGPVAALNGGGITVAGPNVYVTLGQPANQVVAFNKRTLASVALPFDSFTGLAVPRGITFDADNSQFYIANGAGGINVYNASGFNAPAPGGFPGYYGPSGITFDPIDRTLFVANYFGAAQSQPPQYAITEYTENGSAAATFDNATQFVPPTDPAHEQPYAIAFCAATTTRASVVSVGFISDTSGLGYGVGQPFTTSGATYGVASNAIAGNHINAMSCSKLGYVYVADDLGLRRYLSNGQQAGLPSGGFAGLKAPLLGVYAN